MTPAPMLLHEYNYFTDLINGQEHVYIQPKLDGWRAVIHTPTGVIYSRTGKRFFLPHISDNILTLVGLPEWLDGELYKHGLTLPEIQSGIKRRSSEIQFHVFDIITGGIFSDRFREIKETDYLKPVNTCKIKPANIHAYYNEYLQSGYEGAVIRLNAEYEQKRSDKIFKLKPEIYCNYV